MGGNEGQSLLLSPKEYFYGVVTDALEKAKFDASEFASAYLVDLLEQFVASSSLYEVDEVTGQHTTGTLAEMFLKATSDKNKLRVDLLKKLGDTSLYISGFFGDSLNRKLVDIDYYADMGCTAYGSLSKNIRDDSFSALYSEFAENFMGYVDVLTYISHKTEVQNNESVLRIYERYLKTGSELAKEHLTELGLISTTLSKKKTSQ